MLNFAEETTKARKEITLSQAPVNGILNSVWSLEEVYYKATWIFLCDNNCGSEVKLCEYVF